MQILIDKLTINDAPIVFDWVMRLLNELGEEGDELGALAEDKVLHAWRGMADRFHGFVAKTGAGDICGILTLADAFAIYANGNYGIINEMYVAPEYRSTGIGARLVDAAKNFGGKKVGLASTSPRRNQSAGNARGAFMKNKASSLPAQS